MKEDEFWEQFEAYRNDVKQLGEDNERLKKQVLDLEEALMNLEWRVMQLDGGDNDDPTPPKPTLKVIKGGKK